MSRARVLIAAAVLVLFAAAGGILIYVTGQHAAQQVVFNVTVTGAKSMTPTALSAHVNDTVTINITSDTDGEVHLHVYNIPFDTTAGHTVSHSFKANLTCTCDIEWESTSTHLGDLAVSP